MLFATIFVSFLFFYVVAIPLKKEQQEILQQTSATMVNDMINSTPATKVIPPTLSNTLTNYYENIVDQVMETTIDGIISSAPHPYNLLYPGYDCQSSKCPFIGVLRNHLNLLRSNLIATIHPLFESNLQTLPYQTPFSNNIAFIGTTRAISNHLTEALILLNQKISIQLGLIINADKTAGIIIHQSVPLHYPDHRVYHFRHRQAYARRVHHENLALNSGITSNYNKQASKAKKALIEWLRLWLSDIGNTLYTQFDDCIDDVSRVILNSF